MNATRMPGRFALFTFHFAVAVVLAGCSSQPVEVVETREAMSTLITVHVVGPSDAKAHEALAAAWQEMDLGIATLDWHRAPSEAWLKKDPKAREDPAQQPSDVWRINHEAGRGAAEVDPMVTSCLAVAKEIHKLSGGAFDPTVQPVLNVWREAAKQNKMPSDEDLAKACALVGLDKIDIVADMAARPPSDLPIMPPGTPPPTPEELIKAIYYVQLPKKGMGLDLSGVAKGFIIGRMVGRMREFGVRAALVQAGGDIYAIGEKPADPKKPGGDRRWGIGVQDPRFPDDPARLFTAIRVKDKAVTTSGHYYRGYTVEGKRFSHIVDPKTGRPVDNHIASVTVVATDPGVADALSTAVAVMGVEKGMAMIEDLKDVECLILEAAAPEAAAPEPKPEAVRLIPHRSQGFAAMEYKPEAEPGDAKK